MLHIELCLSANTGFALQLDKNRIWIDAVHRQKFPGISTLTPALYEALLKHPAFAAPDLMFHTHCHGDHYDDAWVQQAKQRWPQATLALPEQRFSDQLFLTGNRVRIQSEDTTFLFLRLTHEGKQYADIPHYGLLIEHNGYRILFTGDCEVADPHIEQQLHGIHIDLVILDFPWLTLKKGREYIQNVLRPRQIAVCHLPFSQDDLYGARTAALHSTELLDSIDTRVFLESFQTERFDIP